MSRLLLITLVLLTATSCSDELNARRQGASSNSLRQLGMALQTGHDSDATHNFALAFDSLQASVQNPSEGVKSDQSSDGAVAQPGSPVAPTSAVPPTADRQIIYRASINLQVKNFADTDSKIASFVKDAHGFISQFSEDRSYGAQRGGRWTIRLPIANFTSFLDSVAHLGVSERREVQSQDVTEEYVDLEARLKNKQALEGRLLELVSKRSDNIKDVIALETELGRVREEIERMQGKLRYLKDRVSLTTIEITAYERLDYQPPEATFSARIISTFRASLDNLRQFAEGVVLFLIAFLPWLLVLATIFLPAIYAIRRRFRGRHLPSPSVT
jgi:hypothetical protein